MVGLLFRIIIFCADIFDWFPIFGSGVDSEAFNYYATCNVVNGTHYKLTNYTDFLTFIYSITDCSRSTAQYINVCFGFGVMCICAKTLDLFNIPVRKKKQALCIVAILPNLIIYSGILLREAWIEFFVALSIFQFSKWYLSGQILNMTGALIYACCGIYMHDGVGGLIVGYFIAFTLYDPNSRTLKITASKTFIIFILIVFLVVFSGNFLGEKSNEVMNTSTDELLLKYANHDGTGNSAYLNWLPETKNPIIAFLVAPIKMFYFLFSPIPTDWHRIIDPVGFLIDSVFYILMFWNIYKYYTISALAIYKKIMLISVGIGILMFSFGTFNAGTAFRHRAKFCEPIAIIFAISYSNRNPSRITNKNKHVFQS